MVFKGQAGHYTSTQFSSFNSFSLKFRLHSGSVHYLAHPFSKLSLKTHEKLSSVNFAINVANTTFYFRNVAKTTFFDFDSASPVV